MKIERYFAQMPRQVVPDAQERNPLIEVKRSSRAGEGEAVAAAAARERSEMAATSGAFVDKETAGALFVLCKTEMGARINGA